MEIYKTINAKYNPLKQTPKDPFEASHCYQQRATRISSTRLLKRKTSALSAQVVVFQTMKEGTVGAKIRRGLFKGMISLQDKEHYLMPMQMGLPQ
ncbi:hypothetical protein TNCV_523601 [Trichonephila clavipes]|nr:hypothetical protein TNCV_523601 [Trichonephila clavipes]